MARDMPGSFSHHEASEDAACIYSKVGPLPLKPKWYFTGDEIEAHSPSRMDGIDREYESHLRQLYCSYIQELGFELKVPQVTIATAMMLCHRFYMHQSHARNHWQTVANACMFLACKAEDTPRWLKDLIVVAYKLMYCWDPLAPQKIRQKEVYDQQKQLILLGEQLILVTVAFDINIEHPYKPLVTALKRLEISQKEVVQVAWNFVNDWQLSACKPHHIAAGYVFLAAKRQKIKLPSANGKAWWMQFDVSPKKLGEVIQHMHQLLERISKQAVPASSETTSGLKPVTGKRKSDSSQLCISSGSTVEQDSRNHSMETARMLSESALIKCNQKQRNCDAHNTVQTKENCPSDSGSVNSVVEDGDSELITGDSNRSTGCKIVSIKEISHKIDITRIKERLKRRKLDRVERTSGNNLEGEMISCEAWIERELEKGIELISAFPKRHVKF